MNSNCVARKHVIYNGIDPITPWFYYDTKIICANKTPESATFVSSYSNWKPNSPVYYDDIRIISGTRE